MKGCFIDLMGAMLVGTLSEQFAVGVRLAKMLYGEGNIPVIGTEEKFKFMGALLAMGHSSNVYDIDDGHNMTRTPRHLLRWRNFGGCVQKRAYP